MGDRLTKISTKQGDGGTTGLADGSRVHKSSPRIDALGDIDELSSCLGELARRCARSGPDLKAVRAALFDLGAHVAMPGAPHKPLGALLASLESDIETLTAQLGPLADFILPGGSERGAWAHVCRSVCRRAERSLSRLGEGDSRASPEALSVLNRLSDWLFCQARAFNQADGERETLWRDAQSPPLGPVKP